MTQAPEGHAQFMGLGHQQPRRREPGTGVTHFKG